MNLNFKNLPVADLPYEDISSCKRMMLRLYEKVPYLPFLSKMNSNDNIINRTIENIPGFTYNTSRLLVDDFTTPSFLDAAEQLEFAYNSKDTNLLEAYASFSPFMGMYFEMIKKIQPEYTVINLLGPFSLAEMIFNVNIADLLRDRLYRKFLIQTVGIKALWFLNRIKSLSPETKPLFLLEEPQLYKFGSLKRIYEDINRDSIVTIFQKLFQKIQKCGGYVGVQSFEKCNWQFLLDANVNLISFDAYRNPNSLDIISERIKKFLATGGIINWGVIPSGSINIIKGLNISTVYKYFTKATEGLIDAGISPDMLYRNCTVSVQSNLANIPLLFTEKALMMESQLAKKIPSSSRL